MSLYGSMRTSVSGMNAQANRLATVADNIANSNTTGYKKASTEFSSLIFPSTPGSYNSGSVKTSIRYAISQQGALSYTASITDVAIQGSGFFVVTGANGAPSLTRAGSFVPDGNGYLVNAAGYRLMGYDYANGTPVPVANGYEGLVPVRLGGGALTAIPTTQGTIRANLPAGAEEQGVAIVNLPPSENSPYSTYTARTSFGHADLNGGLVGDVYYTKLDDNVWEVTVFARLPSQPPSFPYPTPIPGLTATTTLTFDPVTGAIVDGDPILTFNPNGETLHVDLSAMTQTGTPATGPGFKPAMNLPSNYPDIDTGGGDMLPSENDPASVFQIMQTLTGYTGLNSPIAVDSYYVKTGPNTWEVSFFNTADATAGTFPYGAAGDPPLATATLTFDPVTGEYVSGSPIIIDLGGGDSFEIDYTEMVSVDESHPDWAGTMGTAQVSLNLSPAAPIIEPYMLGATPAQNQPNTLYTSKTSFVAYGHLGEQVLLDVYFTKGPDGTWEVTVFNPADAAPDGSFPYGTPPLASGLMEFDLTTGRLIDGGTLAVPVPGEAAQAEFDTLRGTWSLDNFAEDERQPTDPQWISANEERLARILSDSDADQVEVSYNEAEQRIEARINPPTKQVEAIEALEENQRRMGQVNRLAMWVVHSREKGSVEGGLTLEEAIELADQLMVEPPDDANDDGFGLARRLTAFAIVGVAAMVAARATTALFDTRLDWVRERLLAGGANRRSSAEESFTVDEALLSFDAQEIGAWGLAAFACRRSDTVIERRVLELAVDRLHGIQKAVLEGLLWDENSDLARRATFAALDVCVIDIGHFWFKGSKERAARRMARRRLEIIKRAARPCPAERTPDLPPAPYRPQWIRGREWYHLPRRVRLISPVVLDWERVAEILALIDWRRLTGETAARDAFGTYLNELIEWTRDYSEGDDSRRHDRRYPYEWAHKMAREVGRFAAFHGDGGLWKSLTRFEERDHSRDLVGNYMEAVAHELMVSERRPDARFWSAWKPAAEWVMATAVPARQSNYDSLDDCVQAAGFVGPWSTPIPPDWPYLTDLLEWIDAWQQATLHLRRAAWLSLRVVERMSLDERASIYARWLGRLVDAHGSDSKFWQYDDLGDRAAALAKPLADHAGCNRPEMRRMLSIIADAGSNTALALVPLFAHRKAR